MKKACRRPFRSKAEEVCGPVGSVKPENSQISNSEKLLYDYIKLSA